MAMTAALLDAPAANASGALPPGSAEQPEQAVPVGPEFFGNSTTYEVLGPWEYHPGESTTTFDWASSTGLWIYRTNAAGTIFFVAPFHLPSGALLTGFRFQACDTSATGQIIFHLERIAVTGGFTQIVLGSTGVAAVPGCQEFNFNLTTPITVSNATESFVLLHDLSEVGPALRLGPTRVAYRLQVSPAPATATFPNDVPTTSPIFRFVEALAASGVTGGCAAGSYCPDSPVTRGQMAVFLATALGLHFAP
jgi:hypothetical protein